MIFSMNDFAASNIEILNSKQIRNLKPQCFIRLFGFFFHFNFVFVSYLVFLILFSGCQALTSPLPNGAKVETKKTAEGLEYSILTFQPKSSGEHFPLVVALHGKGESADDTMLLWEKEAARRRIMVVAPNWETWNLKGDKQKKGVNLENLNMEMNELLEKYPIDPNRLVIAGVSAGGLVARWLLQLQPSRWKAAVFIAFGGTEDWGKKTKTAELPPLLFMHGAQDEQFPSKKIKYGVQTLVQQGVDVTWIEDPDAGHEHRPEWTKQIFEWLESK